METTITDHECAYCHRAQPATYDENEPVPASDDAEYWAAMTEQHDSDCEWLTTRAFRVFPDPATPSAL